MVKKNENDKQVLILKKKVEDKEAALKGIKNFQPKTNCSLTIDGDTYNLHTCQPEKLAFLLVKLNVYRDMEVSLALDTPVTVSGFDLSDWASDVGAKLLIANRQKEEARLKVLKTKLHDLLSTEVKTELLINELQELI